MGGRHWTDEERSKLEPALDRLEGGASIYSQIQDLTESKVLPKRSWDSIRRQLADGLIARRAKRRKEIAFREKPKASGVEA